MNADDQTFSPAVRAAIDQIDQGVPFGAGKEPGEQGTAEWLHERMGNCTASRFKDVMDRTQKGVRTSKGQTYLWEVISERLTGKYTQHYVNDAMAWGTEYEPMARMAYEAATGRMVDATGYVPHPSIAHCGGSPDGLVDDSGIIEIKCPTTATHLKTLLSGEVDEHLPQIMGYLWITGRQWADFISYDPRLTDCGMALYIKRIERDDAYIKQLELAVAEFLAEVEFTLNALRKRSATGAANG